MGQGYGRVAMVSAGSRGIGAATVCRLAADGWDISFCHYEDEQRALEEWLAAVPHIELEFLFYGAIGHFYTRVHHKR